MTAWFWTMMIISSATLTYAEDSSAYENVAPSAEAEYEYVAEPIQLMGNGVVVSINPNLPPMHFSMEMHETAVIITVSRWPMRAREDNVIQVIEAGVSHRYMRPTLIVEDLNFDGYKDIRFVSSVGTTGNVFYWCWVWDVELEQFVELDSRPYGLSGIRLDVENQTLISSAGRERRHYMFIDGVLTPVRRERHGVFGLDEYGERGEFAVTYEKIDGEWVEVDRVPWGPFSRR